MILRWLVAAAHLLALGIGLGAIVVRARALRSPVEIARLPSALRADALWGLAALLWISTGLLRVFSGLEKGSAWYLGNRIFWIKMALLAMIILLEIWPAVTLGRWRAAHRRGAPVNLAAAPALSSISTLQALLVVAMVLAATAMARGIGY